MGTKKKTPTRNERRVARYETDPDYRERMQQGNREAYRRGRTMQANYKANISELKIYGKSRELENGGRRMVYTMEETGAALGGYTVKGIRRWYADGRIPAPEIRAWTVQPHSTSQSGEIRQLVYVYTHAELMAIAKPLAEHQEKCAYLRNEHTEVIRAIRQGVQVARGH